MSDDLIIKAEFDMPYEGEHWHARMASEYRAAFMQALYDELIQTEPAFEVVEVLNRVICEPNKDGTFKVLADGRLHHRWYPLLIKAVKRLPHVSTKSIVFRMPEVSRNTEEVVPRNSEQSTPPQLGERILLLVLRTKDERVNIPGDLEEEFRQIAAKHGARYAKLWYYKQVVASAWPMIRKAAGWGLLASIGAWIRRII